MGSNLSPERRDQVSNRYGNTDDISVIVFISLNYINTTYAGYKTIKTHQGI